MEWLSCCPLPVAPYRVGRRSVPNLPDACPIHPGAHEMAIGLSRPRRLADAPAALSQRQFHLECYVHSLSRVRADLRASGRGRDSCPAAGPPAGAGKSLQRTAKPAAGPGKSVRQDPARPGNSAGRSWQATREKPGIGRPQRQEPATSWAPGRGWQVAPGPARPGKEGKSPATRRHRLRGRPGKDAFSGGQLGRCRRWTGVGRWVDVCALCNAFAPRNAFGARRNAFGLASGRKDRGAVLVAVISPVSGGSAICGGSAGARITRVGRLPFGTWSIPASACPRRFGAFRTPG
jgi:hypothetical protein